MAVNFPNNPQVGETYTLGSRTWQWSGTFWRAVSTTVGYTGSQGATGTSVRIVGSLADQSLLPDPYGGDIGDGYLIDDTGHLWIWNGQQWNDIGKLAGDVGPSGFTGSRGLGIIDTELVNDELIITFEDSTQNNVGNVRGFVGSQGAPGASVRLLGSVNTLQDLPPSPDVGDGYLVTDTGDLYIWNGSQYTNVGKITGETGPLGYTGSQGDQGPIGYTGSSGSGGDLGSLAITGSVISTTDSTDVSIDRDLRVNGDIIPEVDSVFDLGSTTNKWRSLYVSGDTIYINDIPISVDQNGRLLVSGQLPEASVASLADISDVVVSGAVAGQVLGYTGSNWTATTVEGGGGGADSYVKTYFWEGQLVENVSTKRFYIHVTSTLEKITVNLDTAGLTQSTIQIKLTDTVINTIVIPAGTTLLNQNLSHQLAINDYLTVDITQSSSAVNLYVTFVYRE